MDGDTERDHGSRHVIDMGQQPPDQQRPVPWRVIALIAALVIGGFAGYLIGDRHGGSGSARPASSPSPDQPINPETSLSMTGRQCSVQTGHRLQLGVEIYNGTGKVVSLESIEIGLPLKGALRFVTKEFGTCGAVGVSATPLPLAAGASAWINATFDVTVPCPTAIPVLFDVRYDNGLTSARGGFPDLTGVPYTGCPASSG